MACSVLVERNVRVERSERVLCCCCGLFVATEPSGLCRFCAFFVMPKLSVGVRCKTAGVLGSYGFST